MGINIPTIPATMKNVPIIINKTFKGFFKYCLFLIVSLFMVILKQKNMEFNMVELV